MTPRELYRRKPELVVHQPSYLHGFRYNFVPEVDLDQILWNVVCPRLSIKILKDFDFDGRRGWRLCTVWLDGNPCMIIRNAGRELDDHASRFITSGTTYKNLVVYLQSFILLKNLSILDIVDIDTDIADLTEFYGNSLDGHFEKY